MRDTPKQHTRQAVLAAARDALASAPSHPDALWRAARAAYDVSELAATPAADKAALVVEAAAWAAAARERVACSGEPGLVHRWSGVTQSAAAKARGTAAHLAAVPAFAAEFRRAVELDPADATALHLLGRLHFELAGLTWLQRSLAAAVFLTPPPATYDDALRYLLAAESAQPGAWKANHQYLAETFVKLGRRDEALAWTRSGLGLPIKALYDQQAHDLLLKLYATIDADACNKYKVEHAGEPTEIVK